MFSDIPVCLFDRCVPVVFAKILYTFKDITCDSESVHVNLCMCDAGQVYTVYYNLIFMVFMPCI